MTSVRCIPNPTSCREMAQACGAQRVVAETFPVQLMISAVRMPVDTPSTRYRRSVFPFMVHHWLLSAAPNGLHNAEESRYLGNLQVLIELLHRFDLLQRNGSDEQSLTLPNSVQRRHKLIVNSRCSFGSVDGCTFRPKKRPKTCNSKQFTAMGPRLQTVANRCISSQAMVVPGP